MVSGLRSQVTSLLLLTPAIAIVVVIVIDPDSDSGADRDLRPGEGVGKVDGGDAFRGEKKSGIQSLS